MEQSEQNVATNTQLPKSQVQMPSGADTFDTPGTHVFDVDKVSCYYSSFRAVTDVSLKIHENGRFFERFADHAVEIGRRVIFMSSGALPAEDEISTY